MKMRMVFMVTLISLAMFSGGMASPTLGSTSLIASSSSTAVTTERLVTSTSPGNLEPVGQIGGSTRTVAVQGNYAYIGVGPRLVILNISNPAHPAAAGQTEILAGVVQVVKVAGNYAYVVVDQVGLYVFNIATPAAPVQVGFTGIPGRVTGMAVTNNYAYIVEFDMGLHIFNLTDPTTPTEVGAYTDIGEAGNVDVAGNYAYVTTWGEGVRIINVGNPAAPTEAGFYHPSPWWGASDVKVRGDYAYIAGDNGLSIIRITNPAAPTEVSSYATNPHKIALAGNFAYLTVSDSTGENTGLHIINIANPNAPQAVGFYPIIAESTSSVIADITAAGNYIYMAQEGALNENNDLYLNGGLNIINVATPAAPTQAGFYVTPGMFTKVAAAGHYAYAIKRRVYGLQAPLVGILNIFDVINPATPTAAGVYSTRNEVIESVTVVGNYAYVGATRSSENFTGGRLRILNISNPTTPSLVGSHSTPGAVQDVTVVGNYAYIAEIPGSNQGQSVGGGLRIFNIANPAAPLQVGYYAIPDGATAIAMAGNYAYLAMGEKGLWIINIANPGALTQAGAYTAHEVKDVAVAGSYAYLAAGRRGLRIVNISNPTMPTEGEAYEARIVETVTLVGDYAYMAVSGVGTKGGGLGILKITNPTAPTEAGFCETPGFAADVAVANTFIYVADEDGGLLILRFTPEPEASTNPLYLPVIWK